MAFQSSRSDHQIIRDTCSNLSELELDVLIEKFDQRMHVRDERDELIQYYSLAWMFDQYHEKESKLTQPVKVWNTDYDLVLDWLSADKFVANVYQPILVGTMSFRAFCADERHPSDLDIVVAHHPLTFIARLVSHFEADSIRLYSDGHTMANVQFGTWSIDVNYHQGLVSRAKSIYDESMIRVPDREGKIKDKNHHFYVQHPVISVHNQLGLLMAPYGYEKTLQRTSKLLRDINSIINKRVKDEYVDFNSKKRSG